MTERTRTGIICIPRATLVAWAQWVHEQPTGDAIYGTMLRYLGQHKADTAESLLNEVIDWLGAPDWDGPQLPVDLARRMAANGSQADPS